ncbi:hypothetical protein [Actinomycetospora succinea]|uniref:hypothetical protein n=1 Tax=Actinomycetospora succinea TaxID=663603 RepID=UPI001060F880|nr:hypothetical protein [Actinomycetospora succinea]
MLSAISPILTAAVAIGAIVYTRRSASDTIKKDLGVKLWDKRTEVYQDLMLYVNESDIRKMGSVEDFCERARAGDSALIPVDVDSEEWKRLGSRVSIYASKNVASLFSFWKFTLAGWSWNRSALVVNSDKDNPDFDRDAAERDEEETAKSLTLLRDELLLHIRAELDFRQRAMPKIEFRRGAVDGFQAIRMTTRAPFSPMELVADSYGMMIASGHREPDGWSFTLVFDRDLFGQDG